MRTFPEVGEQGAGGIIIVSFYILISVLRYYSRTYNQEDLNVAPCQEAWITPGILLF